MDAEAAVAIGADRCERTAERLANRNGTRPKNLATTAGDLDLRIPELRAGTFYPSLLERRRRIDQALFAVVAEAYVHGASIRKVDDLVAALGVDDEHAVAAALQAHGSAGYARVYRGGPMRRPEALSRPAVTASPTGTRSRWRPALMTAQSSSCVTGVAFHGPRAPHDSLTGGRPSWRATTSGRSTC